MPSLSKPETMKTRLLLCSSLRVSKSSSLYVYIYMYLYIDLYAVQQETGGTPPATKTNTTCLV